MQHILHPTSSLIYVFTLLLGIPEKQPCISNFNSNFNFPNVSEKGVGFFSGNLDTGIYINFLQLPSKSVLSWEEIPSLLISLFCGRCIF